jgi:hypothetical protein
VDLAAVLAVVAIPTTQPEVLHHQVKETQAVSLSILQELMVAVAAVVLQLRDLMVLHRQAVTVETAQLTLIQEARLLTPAAAVLERIPAVAAHSTAALVEQVAAEMLQRRQMVQEQMEQLIAAVVAVLERTQVLMARVALVDLEL